MNHDKLKTNTNGVVTPFQEQKLHDGWRVDDNTSVLEKNGTKISCQVHKGQESTPQHDALAVCVMTKDLCVFGPKYRSLNSSVVPSPSLQHDVRE